MSSKLNLKIYQGSTFGTVFRWESAVKTYAPISSTTKAAPIVVTAIAHSCPVGWRAKITNVIGMSEINSTETYHKVTSTTTDTITINAVNSLAFKDYVSGGVLEYNTPISLLGYTARMQVRGRLQDSEILLEATTENGKISLDNTNKTISITISAADTSTLDFNTAVYSLEMVSSGGQVTTLLTGNMSLIKEVTR